MTDTQRNLAVGLTTLVGIVGLVALLLLFGYVPKLLKPSYDVQVQLPRAAGLYESSRVTLAGIEVGEVTDIELIPLPDHGVLVTASVQEGVDLPTNVQARVVQQLVGGGSTLAFEVPDGQITTDTLAKDGSARLAGRVVGPGEALSSGLEALAEEPIERFNQLSQQIGGLAEEWRLVGEQVNAMVEPRRVADVEAGDAVGNLPTILARVDDRLAQVGRTLDAIESLAGDPQLQDDIRTSASNAREVTESARVATDQITGRIDALSTGVQQDLTQLRRRYVALADDMSGTVASVQALADDAREGEGTLGRLVADPSLYQNLDDASQRLAALMDQARLLLRKFEQEGVPIRF
jgi:phospholipid/cholesterol/gamma-HCH transport system substrate-binding protein